MVVLFAGYYSLFSPTALIANCYLAPFIFATAILVGLGYTGNSPISNYSRVREEIAAFLPVIVIAYILALVLYVVF